MKAYSLATVNLIESLLHESEAMLLRHGETRLAAEKLSCGFVIELSKKAGGQSQYIGKNALLNAQSNRASIREDFKAGCTVNQLAEKYKLTTVRIYQIVGTRKENQIAKADMTLSAHVAITATHMFIKTGSQPDDAAMAARGLLAVITAKFSGMSIYIPKTNIVKTIMQNIQITRYHKAGKSIAWLAEHYGLTEDQAAEISDAYPSPARAIPAASDLPRIKTRLCNMASIFSGYAEINTLLEEATKRISRAEQIIAAL